jgi:glucosamine--fructose-6-phosphate aminotransferase (isomerizing)
MPDGAPLTHTQREILSQPECWAATLDVVAGLAPQLSELWAQGAFDTVLFTGCGSTYYLSLAAAHVLAQLTGVAARGVPASELLLYPAAVVPARGRTLLVAVSRSGTTSETVAAVQAFLRQGRGQLLVLTCYPASELAQLGALTVPLPHAQEESVAQTRSFSSLYLATVALAALWAQDNELATALRQLPAAGRRLLETSLGLVERLDFARCYLLGSGAQYGLACELSLKLKEISLALSEPFHALEFRHGPKSMVSPETLVIGLLGGRTGVHERQVLAEMAELGAQILTIGDQEADIAFAAGLPELARGVLYLPAVQWLACARALAHNLDPDRPHNLDAVVQLELNVL